MSAARGVSRRNFLRNTASGGGLLLLGFCFNTKAMARNRRAGEPHSFTPNAYIKILSDNSIELMIGCSDMGQNVVTGLAMIVAEELDADLDRISVKVGPVDPEYFNPYARSMLTGGSTSTYANYDRLRNAGATARIMLIAAAARHWDIEPSRIRTEKSIIIDAVSGNKLRYGDLSKLASSIPLPDTVKLKPESRFRLVGKEVGRIDSEEKITGRARYGIDVQLPGLCYACVLHPPVFGASIVSIDDAVAARMPGVRKVKQIDSGVAVIADSFWRAKKARDALKVVWDEGAWAGTSSATLDQQYRELLKDSAALVKSNGDSKQAFMQASQVLDETYELPFLAHACMEPLNCTVHDHGDCADIFVGTQSQSGDQKYAAEVLGYAPDKVNIHTQVLGGGFGRRASKTADFVTEAALIARGEPWPIKMVWTREDDMTSGFYRPKYTHRVRVALNKKGEIDAWEHRVVGQRVSIGGFVDSGKSAAFDSAQVEGLVPFPYDVAGLRVEARPLVSPVPTLWWRSVGHSHTTFAMESMVDEAAYAANADPVNYRRKLYRKNPRMLKLLNTVAEMSDWGEELPEGQGLGVAVHDAYSFKAVCAHVAKVRVENGRFRVEKVWCAIDCGFAVNPNGVRAQMEGCVIFGLNGLTGQITFDKGRVVETNFHNYQVCRMSDAPQIEVVIINSGAEMGGIGEPGLPPIVPAVTNAIYAATGKRIRTLPARL
ncbi:xanthine dehydrogenase family protein molybdopterin-binding subunit [Pseudomaricurvus alkylphenolicus]|uniref:xanthine dehydrogenase family protein molybdopterin-binding subunit n=1 Tax=Pseudomaricurvus alkylphenolicus TaxID=1306991 RepID=UPI0014236150|nr:xanthine dehydrogenase family protein molybdopterin-binding subunit [Pseudomaricurvus alkylphenolicus]NIB38447.1 xanthine dehydrogenase family protein molybdopterin-binding subunit [Pseudomaricurvus alkylphenolicus]